MLTEYVAHLERIGRSPKYVYENRRTIETRLREPLGAVLLEKLETRHLDDLYAGWAHDGLAGSTITRYAVVVLQVLKLAQRRGYVDRNPAAPELVTMPRGKSKRETLTPSVAETQALIRAAEARDDYNLAAAIALAFATGARRGELCALRWSDVDLEAGTVTVRRSLGLVGSELLEGPTKTRKVRTIQLDSLSLALLETHKARTSGGDATRVLELTPNKITDRFRKLVAKTDGVRDGVRFHDEPPPLQRQRPIQKEEAP